MEAPKSIPKSMLSFVAKHDRQFLSNTTAARQPAQQPKTRSAFAARGRYVVLGSIYYGIGVVSEVWNKTYHLNSWQKNLESLFLQETL